MKKILYSIFISFIFYSQCFGICLIGSGISEPESDPTPVLQYNLDDNTTGTVVSATYGTNGSISGESNTSDIHSTDYIEGTGSFALDANDRVNIVKTDSWFTDGVFTIQFSIKGDESGPSSAYCRFLADSAGNMRIRRYNSDTSLEVYFAGVSNYFTVSDMDDNQWQTFRVVVNTNEPTDKLRVYQKTESGSWVSKGSASSIGNITSVGSSIVFFNETSSTAGWGNTSAGNKGDQIIIWDAAVLPE